MAEEQEEQQQPLFKVVEDKEENPFGFRSNKEVEQEQESQEEESQEEESSEEQEQEQEQEQESSSEQEEEVDEDQQFLSSLEQKFGRKFESIDDAKSVLTKEDKKVPEYLEKFLEYQEKTGRDFSDYQKLERDLTKVNEDELIRQYMQETNEMLDNEDVDFEMSRQFGFDEEEDDSNDIKAKQIAKKRTYKEALNYFEQQKQEYSKPIGSI